MSACTPPESATPGSDTATAPATASSPSSSSIADHYSGLDATLQHKLDGMTRFADDVLRPLEGNGCAE